MKTQKGFYILCIMAIILALLPIFFHTNLYIMNILIMCLIWGVVAAAWDLIMGYAGIFTFGQIAFFAIGGYVSGMLTVYCGISPWLGIFIGGIITAVVGFLIGLPCLRLKGVYIALITFALHLILDPLLKEARTLGTGGSMGLLGIPPLQLPGYTFSPLERVPWFYSALILSILLLFIIYKIIISPIGLAFTALRDDGPFAESLGVDAYKYKLMVFSISALITGIMGAFYVHYTGMISTKILGLDLFLIVMVMLVVGGMGRFPGVVIGSFAVIFLNELLRPLMLYRILIFGAIVVVLVILMPQGIMGFFETIYNNIQKRFIKIDEEKLQETKVIKNYEGVPEN